MKSTITKRYFLLLLLTLSMMLTSCAIMSPEECKAANWLQVGFDDGRNGAQLGSLQYRSETCAKAGVQVPIETYHSGRNAGLLHFCTPQKAVEMGLAGDDYHGQCPAQLDTTFRRFWGAGRTVLDRRGDVERLVRQEADLTRRAAHILNEEQERKRKAHEPKDPKSANAKQQPDKKPSAWDKVDAGFALLDLISGRLPEDPLATTLNEIANVKAATLQKRAELAQAEKNLAEMR
jgi:Protein of unknown function (DUF2799)